MARKQTQLCIDEGLVVEGVERGEFIRPEGTSTEDK